MVFSCSTFSLDGVEHHVELLSFLVSRFLNGLEIGHRCLCILYPQKRCSKLSKTSFSQLLHQDSCSGGHVGNVQRTRDIIELVNDGLVLNPLQLHHLLDITAVAPGADLLQYLSNLVREILGQGIFP